MGNSFQGNSNTEDTQTHKHTNTHTYSRTNTTRVSNYNLPVPLDDIWEPFVILNKEISPGRFMYSVSPVRYGSICMETVTAVQIRTVSTYLTVKTCSLYKLQIICNVEKYLGNKFRICDLPQKGVHVCTTTNFNKICEKIYRILIRVNLQPNVNCACICRDHGRRWAAVLQEKTRRQFTCNITSRRFLATIAAVEKQ